MRKSISECAKPWSRCTTAAEDHTVHHSCQLQTRSSCYILHELTIIGQQKIATMLPDLRILLKQHESNDLSCLVLMVQPAGGLIVWEIFFWEHFGSFSNPKCMQLLFSFPLLVCVPLCLPGDRLVKVNGQSILGKTYSQVIALIQNRLEIF